MDGTTAYPEDGANALTALHWTGSFTADVTLSMPKTGLNFDGDVVAKFSVGADKIPKLDAVEANLFVKYDVHAGDMPALGRAAPGGAGGAALAVALHDAAADEAEEQKATLVAIRGAVSFGWPCDPEEVGVEQKPLIAGTVTVAVNYDLEGTKAVVKGGRGSFSVACGGLPIAVAASADSLEYNGVTAKEVKIDLKIKKTLGLHVEGSISGTVGYGPASLAGFYTFNTLTGDFSAAVALELDKPPLFIRVEAQVSNTCTAAGTSLRGHLKYSNPPMVEAFADASGVAHCLDPESPTALRYELNITLELLDIADGKLKLTDVVMTAFGYGVKGANLKFLKWDLKLEGKLSTALESSAYAVRATADVSLSATYSPATQAFTEPAVSLDIRVSGAVGPADKPTLSFQAVAVYKYPCTEQLTVAAEVSLDFGESLEMPGKLAAELTIFCPGMDSAERARRVFSVSVNLEKGPAMKVTTGGAEFTLETFALAAIGRESLSVSPDVNAESWVPLPSLSTLDIEGTIVARVSANYDSDGKKAADSLAAQLGFEAGASLALSGTFSKAAGTGMDVVREFNVTVSASFDYVSEDRSVEVHLTATATNECPPAGSTALGNFIVNKPGAIELVAKVSGAKYCAEKRDDNVEYAIEATVEKALVGGSVELRNVKFELKVTAAPVTGAGGGRKYEGSFRGTLGAEALIGLIPDTKAGAASVTASGAFIVHPDGTFEIPGGVQVTVEVDVEFGGGSRIEGLATFEVPCTAESPPINITARASFEAPLPKLQSGEANMVVHCGRGPNFALTADVDTFEVTSGVVFDKVHVDINGSKSNDTYGMWAVEGTVVGSGAAAAGGSGGGQLLWSGNISFDTGPKAVAEAAEEVKLEELPVALPSPPPSPPLPPPVVIFGPGKTPPPAADDCCNPNSVADYWLPTIKCCNANTMRVVEGAQCMTSRWCRTTGCFAPVENVPKTKTCDKKKDPLPVTVEPHVDAFPAPISPPPPPPPEVMPERIPIPPSLEGCCNPNAFGIKEYFVPSDSCCDTASLRVVRGAQCMFSRWCRNRQSVDCTAAKRDIATMQDCNSAVTLSNTAAFKAALGGAAEGEQEDEANKEEDRAPVERSYTAEAGLDLLYSDGNVNIHATGEVRIGSEACEGVQAQLLGKLTIKEHKLQADGNITLHCPAWDGARQIDISVVVDTWEVTPGITIVNASVEVEAVKRGGASGHGSTMEIAGRVRGKVVLSAGGGGGGNPDVKSLPSVAGLEVDVVLTADARFKKPACEAGAGASAAAAAATTSTAVKMLGQVNAAATAAEGEGEGAPGGCSLKIQEINVEGTINVVKGDREKPEFWLKGDMHYTYPCKSGDFVGAKAAFGLSIGEYVVPELTVDARFFCNVSDPLAPVFTLKGIQGSKVIDLGAVQLENVVVDLKAFKGGGTPGAKALSASGLISGYVSVGGLSAAATAAQLGSAVSAKAEFVFDTRTGTFAAAVELTYDTAYFTATMKAAASTKCGAGDAQRVEGFIVFKPESKLQGSGGFSGNQYCGDGEGAKAAGYALILSASSITYNMPGGAQLSIKDVSVKLLGGVAIDVEANTKEEEDGGGAAALLGEQVSTVTAASSMKFTLDARGTLSFRADSGPSFSGLDVSAVVVMKAHWGGNEAVTLDAADVTIAFEFSTSTADDDDGAEPAFSVKGAAHYAYPCLAGGSFEAQATAGINVGGVKAPGLHAQLEIFCVPAAGDPRFTVHLEATEPITPVAGVVISAFTLDAHAYYGGETVHEGSLADAVAADDQGLVQTSTRWTFKGSVTGAVEANAAGLDISGFASFSFNTRTEAIELLLDVSMEKDGLSLKLKMHHASESLCDNVDGNEIIGSLGYDSEGLVNISATVTGAAHCKDHESEAQLLSLPELRVGEKVSEFIKALGDDFDENVKGVTNLTDSINAIVADGTGSAWPRYVLKGQLEGTVLDIVKVKGSMHLFSLTDYDSAETIASVTKWGLEFDGLVTGTPDDSPLAMLKDFANDGDDSALNIKMTIAGAMMMDTLGVPTSVGVVLKVGQCMLKRVETHVESVWFQRLKL